MSNCGGCQGLGAHTLECRDPIGYLAQMAESIGDQVGSNNPALANQAYALATRILKLKKDDNE